MYGIDSEIDPNSTPESLLELWDDTMDGLTEDEFGGADEPS